MVDLFVHIKYIAECSFCLNTDGDNILDTEMEVVL